MSSQSITYSADKVSIKKVFVVIKQQTGYSVLYNPKLIADNIVVSIEARQMPLQDFLFEILKPTSLQYSIKEESIIISKKAGYFN